MTTKEWQVVQAIMDAVELLLDAGLDRCALVEYLVWRDDTFILAQLVI